MKNSLSKKRISQQLITRWLCLPLLSFISSLAIATQVNEPTTVQHITNDAKTSLMTKLAKIDFFSASFVQKILNNKGEVLQTGAGNLAIIKPNLVNWKTTEPDETLIVSDGNTLWFYDPFIEQVNAYSLANAIHNTPILLLTSDEPQLWQQFRISEVKISALNATSTDKHFTVTPLDSTSQIKQLTISFSIQNNVEQLSGFSFKDATNQVSEIDLKQLNTNDVPKAELFKFSLPEGVNFEDNR